MAKQISLKAFRRPGVGRQQARKTRDGGMIPAVIYGSHIQPQPIQVNSREVDRIFKHATSENLLVDLALEEEGKTSNRLALIQEIQHHPVNDRILHLDFHEVRADEKMHARVPIVAVGEPEGVRTGGGILEQVLRELEIECFPKDLPERVEVDVSALQIGGNIHVKELKTPQTVTVLNAPEVSVFSVLAPLKEEVAVAATEVVQPEMIKEKKTEEEGATDEKSAGKAAPKGEGKAALKADGKPEAKAAGKPAEGKPGGKDGKK